MTYTCVMDAGTLPAAWSRIHNMTTMTLVGNSLRGVHDSCLHPTSYTACCAEHILAARNAFQYLAQRQLTWSVFESRYCASAGTLPPGWSSLSTLHTLSMADNGLTGMQTLDTKTPSHVLALLKAIELCRIAPPAVRMRQPIVSCLVCAGELPGEWFNMTQLQGLDLYQNYLRGMLAHQPLHALWLPQALPPPQLHKPFCCA